MLNLYRRKGVTLVTLIAIILVGIILTSTIVISYSSFKTNARKKAFATEIYIIQKQIQDYKLRNNKYPIKNEVEFELSDFDSELVSILGEQNEEIIDEKVKLYTVDLSMLDIESVVRGTQKDSELDVYAYSTKTGNLYYLMGEEIEDQIYYNFNNELYNLLKIK